MAPYTRIPAHCLPHRPTPCPRTGCVYNQAGICDEPRINKGNSDAECHRFLNKAVLAMLGVDENLRPKKGG